MRKLIATLLLMSFNAYAVAPTAINGEAATVKTYSQDLRLPNNQATKLAGLDTRIETGNTNLLVNPSFEHSSVTTGWNATNVIPSAETSIVVDGKKSLKLVLTGVMSVFQDSTINAAQLSGLQGVGSAKIKNNGVADLQACIRNAGAIVISLCVNVPNDNTWHHITIPFIMNGTSNGLALISTTGTTGTVYVDDAFVGTSAPFQNVNGAKLLGTVKITGCATRWSLTSTIPTDYTAQTGCVYTVTGAALAPSTNIPAIKFSSIPAGEIKIEYTGGGFATSANTATYAQFFDGTNYAREVVSANVNSVTQTPTFTSIDGSFTYATSQSNIQFNLRGSVSSGSTALSGTTAEPAVIKVWYFPPESKIYSQTNAQVKPTAFTPTVTGMTYSDEGTFWHREGKFLVARGTGAVVTPTATALSVKLPIVNGSQLIIDSSVQSATTNSNSVGVLYDTVGTAALAFPTVARGPWVAFTDTAVDSTVVYFSSATNSSRFDKTLANALFSNGDRMRFEFKVPIVGWDQYDIVGSFAGIEKCANDYECTDTFSAQVSATGVVSNQNIPWISSCTNANPTVCTLNSNLKDGTNALSSAMNCTLTLQSTGSTAGMVTTNTTSSIAVTMYDTVPRGTLSLAPFVLKCQKGSQDYKPKTAKIASSNDVVLTTGTSTRRPFFGSATITQTATIARQFGDLFSGCSVVTNQITCNFNTSKWASTPVCGVSCEAGYVAQSTYSLSSSAISYMNTLAGVGNNIAACDIWCHGAQP